MTGASLIEYCIQEKTLLKNMHPVAHAIMQIDYDNRECDARHLLESTSFVEYFDATDDFSSQGDRVTRRSFSERWKKRQSGVDFITNK